MRIIVQNVYEEMACRSVFRLKCYIGIGKWFRGILRTSQVALREEVQVFAVLLEKPVVEPEYGDAVHSELFPASLR